MILLLGGTLPIGIKNDMSVAEFRIYHQIDVRMKKPSASLEPTF